MYGYTHIFDVTDSQSMTRCQTAPDIPSAATHCNKLYKSKKVKSSMARSLPLENLLPQNIESIINYLQ